MSNKKTKGRTGLPHGLIPIHRIADPQTRDAMMQMNENMAWLARKLAALSGNDRRG